MINNKKILVTGGTGSFGKNLISHLEKKFNPKKIIIFSRDELKSNDDRVFQNQVKAKVFYWRCQGLLQT